MQEKCTHFLPAIGMSGLERLLGFRKAIRYYVNLKTILLAISIALGCMGNTG
jgi:hypothetical protein